MSNHHPSSTTASMSAMAPVRSKPGTPSTSKMLKPLVRAIFQRNPFAEKKEIYQWLKDEGKDFDVPPMITSDKELAKTLKT